MSIEIWTAGRRKEIHSLIEAGPLTVGRRADCTLCLDDPRVSGLHCKIELNGEVGVVTDLSTNGTFLSGERLKKGVPQELAHGQVISPVVISRKSPSELNAAQHKLLIAGLVFYSASPPRDVIVAAPPSKQPDPTMRPSSSMPAPRVPVGVDSNVDKASSAAAPRKQPTQPRSAPPPARASSTTAREPSSSGAQSSSGDAFDFEPPDPFDFESNNPPDELPRRASRAPIVSGRTGSSATSKASSSGATRSAPTTAAGTAKAGDAAGGGGARGKRKRSDSSARGAGRSAKSPAAVADIGTSGAQAAPSSGATRRMLPTLPSHTAKASSGGGTGYGGGHHSRGGLADLISPAAIAPPRRFSRGMTGGQSRANLYAATTTSLDDVFAYMSANKNAA